MLKLVVVDATAESRNRLFARISELLRPGLAELEFLPHIDVQQQSPDQLRFNDQPDICIVGRQLVRQDLTAVGKIKKTISGAPLLAEVDEEYSNLSILEQLARFGADDVIASDTAPIQFIRKLVLLCRKPIKKNSGKLYLVDSGKGGIGVTTITAGLAEALYNDGKRVAVVDFDLETQDLSRFLQVRPFVNDNLQALLDRSRPLTQDFVEECLLSVFDSDRDFTCMAPAPDSDGLYDPRATYARTFLSILEILDHSRDLVLVDVSSARGALLRTLYRVADGVIFVVNNDAATLFASVDRLQKLRHNLSPESEVFVLENCALKHGLPSNLLKREFLRAAQLNESAWITNSVPFCRQGYRWPGSGGTIYSQGSDKLRATFKQLSQQAGLSSSNEELGFLEQFSKKAWSSFKTRPDKNLINALPNSTPNSDMPSGNLLKLPEQQKMIGLQTANGSTPTDSPQELNNNASTGQLYSSTEELVSTAKLSVA